MAAALSEAAEAAGIEDRRPCRASASARPATPNEKTGTVSAARNIPGWEGSFELGAGARPRRSGPRCGFGNDVQVATDAEFQLGAGKPYKTILGVFWGTGVGGGLVLDGKPWLGRGAAAEIGHVVVHRNGARCPCGRRGCMEAYAGRAAMERKARRDHRDGVETKLFKIMEQRGKDRLTSGVWEHALRDNDALAESLLRRAVRAIGTAVASAQNLLDVEAIILGGGLGLRLGESYADEIKREMHKHLFVADRPPDFKLAALGDLGGAIGASLLVAKPAPTPA